jgi:hypothetical protein
MHEELSKAMRTGHIKMLCKKNLPSIKNVKAANRAAATLLVGHQDLGSDDARKKIRGRLQVVLRTRWRTCIACWVGQQKIGRLTCIACWVGRRQKPDRLES